MKNLFGKAVLGFLLASLCSVAACMAEVDRPTATDGTEATTSVQVQSLSIQSPNECPRGHVGVEATTSVQAQSLSSQSPSENPPGHVGAAPANVTNASLDTDPTYTMNT